ncbi:hypothetical protein B5F36_04250 [Anaerofilum sp. An201]|nr:hypothetical protein [Anaerofilum sp. An201]OUP04695.1 hypothetical protein B5F36_04250 [Anaerofilum sp. An201]
MVRCRAKKWIGKSVQKNVKTLADFGKNTENGRLAKEGERGRNIQKTGAELQEQEREGVYGSI